MEGTVEGVVLCRIGAHRLAVLAGDVAAVAPPAEGTPYAARAFATHVAPWPESARQLGRDGTALVVDSVEIHGERLRLFPVPTLLARVMGGALRGFVETAGALWPVVSLERFSRHLLEAGR